MTIDTKALPSRRPLRAAAVTSGLVLGSLAASALAAPPDTDPWQGQEAGSRSLLDDLLFLVGVPVLVFVVVALLVYLPSMIRRQSTEPALAFRERTEWFGGPRKGVDATSPEPTEQAKEKGGASARW